MSARINAMQINTEHAQHGMLYLLDMKQACKQCALKSTIDELTAYMTRGGRRGLEGKEAEVVEITQELGPCMRATCKTSVSHTHKSDITYKTYSRGTGRWYHLRRLARRRNGISRICDEYVT